LWPASRKWWLSRRRRQRLRLGQASADDATGAYLRFLEVLERRGIARPAWFTPGELMRVLRGGPTPLDPHSIELAGQFTAAYQELRFGGRAEAAPRMTLLLDELESTRSRRR
jgi:hypothetical protein